MKKKDREKKKADMPEFAFKEFTPDEDRIYGEAVNAYREAITAGRKLKDAYDVYPVANDELRALIQADFLKILIAERHFAKREPLEGLASSLGVSLDLMKDTVARMLQEVGVTAANRFGQEMRGVHPDEIRTND